MAKNNIEPAPEAPQRSAPASAGGVSPHAAQIFKGAGWFGIASASGIVLEYVTQIYVAIHLGPEGFGLLSVGIQIFSFCLLFSLLAMPNSLTYFIPRHPTGDDRVERLITDVLWLGLITGLLIGASLFVLAQPLANVVFSERDLVPVMRILAIALPASTVTALVVGALRGLKLSRQASLLSTTYERGLRLAFTALLLSLGFGLFGAALAYVPAAVIIVALSLRVLYANTNLRGVSLPTWNFEVGMASYTWPVFLSQLVTRATIIVQPLLLLYFLDATSVGIYSVALFFPQAFGFVLGAFNFLYFPVVSGSMDDGGLDQVRQMYQLTTRWSLLLTLPSYLIVMLVPEVFLGFFGAEFQAGAWALRVLATGALINVGSGMVGSTLLAFGKSRVYLYIYLFSLGMSTLFGVLLIPEYGMVGAALAQLAANLGFNGIALLIAFRLWNVQPFDVHYRNILFACLGGFLPFSLLIVLLVDVSPWTIFGTLLLFTSLIVYGLNKLNMLDEQSQALIDTLNRWRFR